MNRMKGFLPSWLAVGFLMVAGTAIAIAQQPSAGQQMYSMTMMMNRMDSLMTEMHGMLPGGHHMMSGSSMHGMMMTDSQTATDSLAWSMNAIGSSMRDAMSQMHQLLGEQGYIQEYGRQETLAAMQRNMQTMIKSYQGMMHEMQTLRVSRAARAESSMK